MQNLIFTNEMVPNFRKYVLQILKNKPFTDFCSFCFKELKNDKHVECLKCYMPYCDDCKKWLKEKLCSKC